MLNKMVYKSSTIFLVIIIWLLAINAKDPLIEGKCWWTEYKTDNQCDLKQITVPGQKAANAIHKTTKATKTTHIALSAADTLHKNVDKIKKIADGISILSKLAKFAGPAGFVIGAVGDIITMFTPEDNNLQNVVDQVNKMGKQLVKCVKQEVTKAIAKQDKKHFDMLSFDINFIAGYDNDEISPQLTTWENFRTISNRLQSFMENGNNFVYYEKVLPAVSAFVQTLHFGILQYINTLYQCRQLNDTVKCNPAQFPKPETVRRDHQKILQNILTWAIEARDTIYYHYKFPFPIYKGIVYDHDISRNYYKGFYKKFFSDVVDAGGLMEREWEMWTVNGDIEDNYYIKFVHEPGWCHVTIYDHGVYDAYTEQTDVGTPYFRKYYDDNYQHSAALFHELHSYISQIKSFINFIDNPGGILSELILIGQDMDCVGSYDDLGKANSPEDCEKLCIDKERKNPNNPCMFFEYGHPKATSSARQKQCNHLTSNCKQKTGKVNWYNVFARVKPVPMDNYKIYPQKECGYGNNGDDANLLGYATSVEECIQLCYAEQISNGIHCKWIALGRTDDKDKNKCWNYPTYSSRGSCGIIETTAYDLVAIYDTPFIKLAFNKECNGKEFRQGKEFSAASCAEACDKDPKCEYFLYSEHKDRDHICYFEYECDEKIDNEYYDLYAVISLIGKSKKCSQDSVDLDNKLYISPEACYIDCVVKGGKYIAFGNEQKSKARQCICYKDNICTEIGELDFDLYSTTKKTHIACPELYRDYDDNCCYGHHVDGLDVTTAKNYCNQMSDMKWISKDYNHYPYTCCQIPNQNVITCPSHYNYYDENCCSGRWSAQFTQGKAKDYCDQMSDMEWIPKDYSKNGYTCCIKGTQSISYYYYYKSLYYSHYLLSNILISIMICSLFISLFLTGICIYKRR
eukprot:285299_1